MAEPKDVQAYKMGARLFREGKTLEALKYFKFAATTGEDRPMEHFALASALMQLGDLFGARNEYQRFLDMASNLPKQEQAARVTLEKIAQKLGVAPAAPSKEQPKGVEKGKTEQCSEKQNAPESKEMQEQRAVSEPLESEGVKPVESPPESGASREELDAVSKLFEEALNYYRAAGYSGALKRLDELANRWGRTSEVLNLSGLCHLHEGRFDEAIAILEEAREISPEDADVLLNLSRGYFESGAHLARNTLDQGIKMFPRNAGLWFNLGVVRLATGDFKGAHDAWSRVLEIDPGDKRAQANLDMISGRIQ